MAIVNRRPGLGPKRARSLEHVARFLAEIKYEPGTIDVCHRLRMSHNDLDPGREYIEQLVQWRKSREETSDGDDA